MLKNSPRDNDIAHVLHPYTDLTAHETKGPLIITSGQGVWVKDDSGKEYLEGLAGLWCTSLGYGEERLAKAAYNQMMQLGYSHIFAHKSHPNVIELATKLINMAPQGLDSPMQKVFFANSGSEAVDTAIKIVYFYHNAIGKRTKKLILSRHNGYHGVTVAGASLTGLPTLHKDFDLPIIPVHHLTSPHFYRNGQENESEEQFTDRLIKEVEETIAKIGADNIGAMIAEPIQGAGAVIMPPKGYWAKLQPILKKHDILLIADEVICGFGRTGECWGSQYFGIKPDMMTMAKQLSSAYIPISGVMINQKISEAVVKNAGVLGTFGTGYTYSGHPVSAAVALETLKIYDERKIFDNVKKLAPLVQENLKKIAQHPLVGNVRGAGLIGAVELVKDKKNKVFFEPSQKVAPKCANMAEKHGLIIRPLPYDSVAFCPPLVINEKELQMLFQRIGKALDDTANEVL